MDILDIEGWDCPAGIPEQRIGKWRIAKRRQSRGMYWLHNQVEGYELYQLTKPGQATLLQELRKGRWQDWMTDQALYWYAMQRISEQARGATLVIGLGLGLVLRSLEANPDVQRIVVVERQPEVIEMVWPHVQRPGVVLEATDFYQLPQPRQHEPFDTIIADLWVGGPGDRAVQEGFLDCYEEVNQWWPEAAQFYHGIQAWAVTLSTLRATGGYESLRREQKLALLRETAERRVAELKP
jgi:hypothetical protein